MPAPFLRQIRNRIFGLSVIIGLAGILALMVSDSAEGSEPAPNLPVPCMEKHWLGQHNYLTALVRRAGNQGPVDVYFLGDSITEFWPTVGKDVWQAEFGKMRVLNCGVSGDKTQNILFRITHGEFDRIQPKVVVLLAGINNLSNSPDLQPEDLARGIQRIVSVVHGKSPASKVLLLSIFPADEPANPIRKRILATNELIAKLADDKSVYYLDIHDRFLNERREVPSELSPDGTHPSAIGYQVWAEAMRPLLRQLLELNE